MLSNSARAPMTVSDAQHSASAAGVRDAASSPLATREPAAEQQQPITLRGSDTATEPAATVSAAAVSVSAASAAASARASELDAMLDRGHAAIAATIARVIPDLQLTQLRRGVMAVGRLAPYLALADKALRIRAAAAAAGGAAGGGEAESITMVLFGGSTAAGEELNDASEGFAHMFGAFLAKVLRVPVAVNNLAMGATSSDYYALCGGSHMLPGSDVILAEHALNVNIYDQPGSATLGDPASRARARARPAHSVGSFSSPPRLSLRLLAAPAGHIPRVGQLLR